MKDHVHLQDLNTVDLPRVPIKKLKLLGVVQKKFSGKRSKV